MTILTGHAMNKKHVKREGMMKNLGAAAGRGFDKLRSKTRKHLSGPAGDPTHTEIQPEKPNKDSVPTDPEEVKRRNSRIKLPSQLTRGSGVSNFKEFFYRSDK